jgi:hypothetical protein
MGNYDKSGRGRTIGSIHKVRFLAKKVREREAPAELE